MRSILVAASASLFACGGQELQHWPSDATVHVLVTRDDAHPNYRCEGDVQTRFTTASFSCTAEGFDGWTVRGHAEEFVLEDRVRLWIRDSDGPLDALQPEIAIDLEPQADRFAGWATVILPDGTRIGHTGGKAEAR